MRKLAIFAFSFSFAIFLCVYFLSDFWQIVFLCAILSALLFFLLRKVHKTFSVLSLILAGIWVGTLWFGFFESRIVSPVAALAGNTEEFTVIATDFSSDSDYGSSFEARIVRKGIFPVRVKVYSDFVRVEPGDMLRFQADLRSADVWHGEDSERFTSQGVFLILQSKTEPMFIGEKKLMFFPRYWAKGLQDKIGLLFHGENRALFLAILSADKTELYEYPELTASFRAAGVYHILVVSGMHLSFLSSVMISLFGRRKWALCLCVPLLVLFSAMTGFTPSVSRALVMQLFLIGASFLGQENDSVTSLSVSLLLLLAVNPYSVAHVGLQFSFASTLGIILFSHLLFEVLRKHVKDYKGRFRAFVNKTLSIISVSVSASIFTVPLSAIYYGNFSLIAPITNICTMWAFTAAFICGLTSCMIGFIWTFPARVIVLAARLFIWFSKTVVDILSSFPLSFVPIQSPVVFGWVIFCYILIFLFLVLKNGRRILVAPMFLSFVILCVGLILMPVRSQQEPLTLRLLDVGQGQCALLSSEGVTVLYDCGSSDRLDSGTVACNALKAESTGRIDVAVFSHFDRDHTNGFTELCTYVPVGCVLIPSVSGQENPMRLEILNLCARRKIPVYEISERTFLSFGDSSVTVFPPIGEDDCLALLASQGEYDILLTGDLSKEEEVQLLSQYAIPQVETLVVGHHGSKNASSMLFLEALTPREALISVGYNQFGHPSEETLTLLDRYHIPVYRTDLSGTITCSRDSVREEIHG